MSLGRQKPDVLRISLDSPSAAFSARYRHPVQLHREWCSRSNPMPRAASAFMKQQPGVIATQLHRGTAGSTAYANVAVWESAQSLAPGVQHPPVPGPPRPLPRHQHRSPAPVHQGRHPRHQPRLIGSRPARRHGPNRAAAAGGQQQQPAPASPAIAGQSRCDRPQRPEAG